MPPAVLYPHYDHDAVEESFASWQAQMRLRREHGPLFFYDDDESALSALEDVDAEYVLVITDPLLVPPPHFGDELQKSLTASKAFAAVPMTNETANDTQRGTVQPYMTLRELEESSRSLRRETGANELTRWERGNPGAFLVRTADAREILQALVTVDEGGPARFGLTAHLRAGGCGEYESRCDEYGTTFHCYLLLGWDSNSCRGGSPRTVYSAFAA